MKRRTFISAMSGGVMMGKNLFARKKIARKGGALKKLVVLFQRGGNDGLNTIIPVDPAEHALYMNLRPNIGLNMGSVMAIPNESFFAFNPALSSLVPLVQAGNLSLIHAVGYPNPDRSHFESQSFYETAVPGNTLLDGWLNRFLSNTTGPGLIRGISIGSNIPQSATGSLPIPVSQNFGQTSVGADYALDDTPADNYRGVIESMYQLGATPGNDSVYNTGNNIFQMVQSFADRDWTDPNYTPDNGAVYPNTGLGNRVMHAAQMLKDDTSFLGVEVVTIDQGGYDTHANQVNAGNRLDETVGHPRLLRDLGDCMAAFYTDMGPTRMDDILFLVVTEFGRRAYQNDSTGTDHGTGAVVMAMGNAVNGNNINGGGAWPGLANLYQGDDLNWVTDYRDIYWDVLSAHMGVDNATLNTIIPGHTNAPVGFL